MKIGIDFGGVIISKDTDSDQAFFSPEFLKASEVEGSILTLIHGIGCFEPENIYLISKCSEKIEQKTRKWLDYRYFWKETGLLPENLIFCRSRSDKALIAENLGLNFFVDDRYSVLKHMIGLPTIVNLFLFRPSAAEKPESLPSEVILVNHWYWINAFFQAPEDRALPEYPLPPYWSIVENDESRALAERFFDQPDKVAFLMRCSQPEEYSYIQIGPLHYFYSMDWTSTNRTSLGQFTEKNNGLTKSQLIQAILEYEETWFGWPPRDHPVWSGNPANGA